MKVGDVVQARGATWTPEEPIKRSLTYDDRYMGARSVFEVSGDVVQQVNEYLKANVEANRPIVSWDRLNWDEPWERPKPVEYVPMIAVHAFDGVDAFLDRDPSNKTSLLTVGMLIRNLCYDVARGLELEDFVNRWNEFADCASLTTVAPSRGHSSMEYVMAVQDTMDAAIRLKPAWFDFLDQAVLTAQRGLKLPHPPVFVFLFLDFHLAPGVGPAVEVAFRKMSHPRLLCLFGKSV